MGGRALVLSALSWFLTRGFPSSFIAKFLSGDTVDFSGWPWGASLWAQFCPSLDTLQVFTRTNLRGDRLPKAVLGPSVLT